jgi:hypothetical protein
MWKVYLLEFFAIVILALTWVGLIYKDKKRRKD